MLYRVHLTMSRIIRDRPFNLQGWGYGFFFRLEFFFRTTRELKKNCRVKREIFFQDVSLGYMTKTESDYFVFLHQNQNSFSATLGIRIFFY
jgi:hypothetical protein